MIAHGIVPGLAWALAACLAAVGAFAILLPALLSDFFGVPVGARGFSFVRTTGWRDVVIAGILAVAAARRDRPEIIAVAAFGVALALGDALLVWFAARRFTQPILAHLTGAAAFIVLLESALWP